jgi:hypothetical protein
MRSSGAIVVLPCGHPAVLDMPSTTSPGATPQQGRTAEPDVPFWSQWLLDSARL